MQRWADVAAGIVAVALATTLVAHRNTASVVSAVGRAFSDSLLAAQGKRP
jgi:hypothetical protein